MSAEDTLEPSSLPVEAIRRDFPLLERRIHGRPILYLDSAATSLKPRQVIRAIVDYYENRTASPNRGVHLLSVEATELFEAGRETVAEFIGASPRDVVFVRNATEAIHLVAQSLPRESRVLYTMVEHHSNFLPWLERGNAEALALLPDGGIDLEDLDAKLNDRPPDLLAIAHVSNAFGVVQPLEKIIAKAHAAGARVLVDGSQSVPHRPVDVSALDCDYLCFSGHKMCGPGGVGVLYGKPELLRALTPRIHGGDMVKEVHAEDFVLREVPWRFEAGTPSVESVIGLAAACQYLERFGRSAIEAHEQVLLQHAMERLRDVPGLTIRGPLDAGRRASSVAFTLEGLEAHGAARMLSQRFNICVRSGFHCAQPAHEALASPPTVRASFYLYNTTEEIDELARALCELSAYL